MTLETRWRPMLAGDIAAVVTIAAQVHPGFFEAPEVFAERQALYAAGAHLLEIDGRPAGYMISHPWRFRQMPALNTLLGAIPPDADTYYIHDLALLPAARGTGAAGAIVAALSGLAREAGLPTMSLVAVNGSLGFWRKQGFSPLEAPELADKLRSYEEAARFMVKSMN